MSLEEITSTLDTTWHTARSDMVAAGVSNGKMYPVISVVMDRATGQISNARLNQLADIVPADMHPTLASRLPGAKALPFANTIGAGSHAEVWAVNELLNKGSKIEDLVVLTRNSVREAAGTFKEACPHCSHLLEGVSYVR